MDHPLVAKFMAAFHRLENVDCIRLRAYQDAAFRNFCAQIADIASDLRVAERSKRELFSNPTDPSFIALWRIFEEKYECDISDIGGTCLLYGADDESFQSAFDPQLRSNENSNFEAEFKAEKYRAGLSRIEFFARCESEDVSRWEFDERREFEAGAELIENSDAFLGANIFKTLERRSSIPFVFIPRHVARMYGEGESLTLQKALREAQDAYGLGLFVACLQMLRGLVEHILSKHYASWGDTLEDKIDNCRGLPIKVSTKALHRLRRDANDSLHDYASFKKKDAWVPGEVLNFLRLVGFLIEGVPVDRKESVG